MSPRCSVWSGCRSGGPWTSQSHSITGFCSSALALSILTAVSFGLVPALRATRPDLIADLKADARGKAPVGRFGPCDGLVVAQVAICTVLLVWMGLFLRSLYTTRGMDLGLRNRNLLLLHSILASTVAPIRRPGHCCETFWSTPAFPGVESATLTSAVPLTLIVSNSNFVPGITRRIRRPTRPHRHLCCRADFFATMGISFPGG